MTDLTKSSEALLEYVETYNSRSFALVTRADLARIEAAVRADTLADVAARLAEALHAQHGYASENEPYKSQHDLNDRLTAAAILAHLGGTDR